MPRQHQTLLLTWDRHPCEVLRLPGGGSLHVREPLEQPSLGGGGGGQHSRGVGSPQIIHHQAPHEVPPNPGR